MRGSLDTASASALDAANPCDSGTTPGILGSVAVAVPFECDYRVSNVVVRIVLLLICLEKITLEVTAAHWRLDLTKDLGPYPRFLGCRSAMLS